MNEFILEIFDENPKLFIWAFGHDWALCSESNGKLHYFYKPNEDTSYHFNLLSEVSKYYQNYFEFEIAKNRLVVSQIETENDYFDAIHFDYDFQYYVSISRFFNSLNKSNSDRFNIINYLKNEIVKPNSKRYTANEIKAIEFYISELQ